MQSPNFAAAYARKKLYARERASADSIQSGIADKCARTRFFGLKPAGFPESTLRSINNPNPTTKQ